MKACFLHAPLRCIAVWSSATLGAAALSGWALFELRDAPGAIAAGFGGQPFERLLVWLFAAVLAACAAWLWLVISVVVVEALVAERRGGAPMPGPRHGIPGWVQSSVLVACGLAVVGAGTPALATPGSIHVDRSEGDASVVSGLPLPDRPSGNLRRSPSRQSNPHLESYVVRGGDSLWAIARDHLGEPGSAADIEAYVDRLYADNRSVVGADPDLIRPGQHLRMPRDLASNPDR